MADARTQPFLDSNVILYLLSEDATKADTAERILKDGVVISVQVLNEVTQVCRRKLRMDWPDIDAFLRLVRSFCRVVALSESIHDLARALAAQHHLGFYDACIVAAAKESGCRLLYTEDMHSGLAVQGGPTLHNPFGPDAKATPEATG